MKRWRRHLVRLAWFGFLGGILGLLTLVACDLVVVRAAEGKLFASVDEVPETPVAIVLGTSKWVGPGRENRHYRHRIDAAAALWKAGKVEWLIVSGDNGTADYDEPTSMRADLVRAGVPAERIYRDFAGFRTLDTVVRARRVFGVESCVIVSQRWHLERAIFLARHAGLEAVGYDARDTGGLYAVRNALRERAARVVAVADVLVDRGPRHLGPKIVLGRTRPT